ncbi:MAG: GNAT family N-acetyltransferase, partial [Methanomassiliicoccales archaeon]|nr:GNAT family N-acetyltransferase [Methanomassiliicoccales archaeon]
MKEFKEPWERLEELSAGSIFSSYVCTTEWIKCFGDLVEPSVLVKESGDEIEYIAPLAIRKGRMRGLPVRVLGMIGTILDTSEYYDLTFLRRKGYVDNLNALIDGMSRIKWDVLQFRDVEDDDLLQPLIEEINGRWPGEKELARPSPLVTLSPHADPISNFEPRTGRRIQRIIADLRKESRFETRVAKTPEMVETAMKKYLELHIARWESKGGSIFKDARQKDFLINLPVELAKKGKAWVLEVLIDGEIASQQLCLLDKKSTRMYRVAMNDAFRSYAPGYLTSYFAMLEAMKSGSNIFDMGPGAEE